MALSPRNWLGRQDPINRAFIVLIACALLSFGAYRIWNEWQFSQALESARTALAQRHFEEASAHLIAARRIRENSGELHYLAAQTARRTGRWNSAEDHLLQAEELNWAENAIAFERSLLLASTGDFRKQEPILLAYLKTEPPPTDADLVLEVIIPLYLNQYKARPVLNLMNTWAPRYPEDIRFRLWQYEAAHFAKSWNTAAEALEAAVALQPEDAELRLKLANIYMQLHRGNDAHTHFQWLLVREPTNQEYRFGLARSEREIGNTKQSILLMDELLEQDPQNALYQAHRAFADLTAGRPEQALPRLLQAVKERPYEYDLVQNLILCFEQCNKPEEAETWRQRAKAIEADLLEMRKLTISLLDNTQDADKWYRAGMLLRRNGQVKEARRWFENALRVDPGHAEATKALQELMPTHTLQNPGPLPR